MQKIIDKATNDIIDIINSKPNSLSVAHQFIYEELEAAYYVIDSEEELIDGLGFLEHRVRNCGISKEKCLGAMNKSWDAVDGSEGPQQYLLEFTLAVRQQLGKELSIMFRISVVENIIAFFKLGKYKDNKKKQEKKDINLFKIVINENKLHSHFKYLLKDENSKLRDVLSEWSIGFKDRDNKFVKQFQETFNSSFWELYIYKCLKKLNYIVDFDKSSPDFVTYTSYSTLCIEATTANEAKDDNPEWTQESFDSHKTHEEFMNYATFRLFDAVSKKNEHYKKVYSKLGHVEKKPYIIAVAPFEQSMFSTQNNVAINRVLYAKEVDIKKMDYVDFPFCEKNDGTKLELGIFRSDKYSDISAIIFSTTATISKVIVQTNIDCDVRITKYKEIQDIKDMMNLVIVKNLDYNKEILDGLQVHHNPYAKIPLDLREFDNHYITHYFYDVENDYIVVEQNEGTLVSRNTIFAKIVERENTSNPREKWEENIKEVLEKNKDKKDEGVISELLNDSDLEDF
ncbi:hypothetical protein KKG81_10520 [bacterium]|nr:hypothetical protein [bacterium]